MTPPAGWQARESLLLAPYAMHAADSAGRVHLEPPHPIRSPYQRDHDRIVHSSAFRRLAHKTQVFTGYLGDYHRSRLTHTLEVTGIARTLGRGLALNEDLVETLALAHDIGHPPLGHAGEDTLDELLADEGGFNHNAQALRIMELLETRYPDFSGLNLSREILEAQAARVKGRPAAGIRPAAAPLLETQVVDAADSIAYDTHDADDAIELGLVALEELLELPLVAEAAARAADRYGPLDGIDRRRAVIHELVDMQAGDLIKQSQAALARLGIDSVASVRSQQTAAGQPLRIVTHSPQVAAGKKDLEAFLFRKVYRSKRVMGVRLAAQAKLSRLFHWYCAHPDSVAPSYRERVTTVGLQRSVADYLAGMTDRYLEWDYDRRV
ncbi:MAG: dNTP triphosphohydrolase [Planctomycetota bacterium]|jgi:dGTPase|nr:dNTP triphosphohydrolase [Planctomycetota bacterium]